MVEACTLDRDVHWTGISSRLHRCPASPGRFVLITSSPGPGRAGGLHNMLNARAEMANKKIVDAYLIIAKGDWLHLRDEVHVAYCSKTGREQGL